MLGGLPMHADKGIYWLASYPKSGNTWFRIFLANLMNDSDDAVDINQINTGAIASARGWVDQVLGFESSDLSMDELDRLRPDIYSWHAEHIEHVGHHKIHDAYTYVTNTASQSVQPLIPLKGCLGAIYFIRNPLDVAISFANHSNCSIDKAIEYMGDENYAFCKSTLRQHNQLRQWLLSWSLHVQSWATAKNLNLLILRYEDMLLNSEATFTRAVEFLNLDYTAKQIKRALQLSNIETLQQMEQDKGFREKPAKMANFFRKGVVGDWKTTLTEVQIARVIADHSQVMGDYGYLDEHS